jgi:hypothetical protein
MGLLSKTTNEDAVTPIDPSRTSPKSDNVDAEKGHQLSIPSKEDEDEVISFNAQAGVKKAQAATTVWTKGHLIAAYVMYGLISSTAQPCG